MLNVVNPKNETKLSKSHSSNSSNLKIFKLKMILILLFYIIVIINMILPVPQLLLTIILRGKTSRKGWNFMGKGISLAVKCKNIYSSSTFFKKLLLF